MHNRLQRGAVGPGKWGHALACVVGWGREIGIAMLSHAIVGVRNARSLCFTSSGMLLSYRLGCDFAWYAAMFVFVCGRGRLHQHVQRGAV